MAILNHGSTIRTADGGQSTTAIVTASNIGTYGIAANSTYYIGTTQNVFNRASGAQTLTGVSIDGNAANITAYTINQNVGTGNTPSFAGLVSSAITNYAFLQVTDTNNFWITPGNNNWGLYFETSAGGLLGGTGDSNRLGFVGAGAARFYVDLNNGNGWFGGSLTANTDSRAPIFYDSNNTSYYLDAANSGTSLLVAGNVGIGTTSPASKLHIDDASTPYITITRAGVPTWQLRNNFPNNQYGFSFNNTTAGTVPLFIGTGGNIGIGLDNPTVKLDIASTQGNGIVMRYDTSTAYQAWIRPYWNSGTDTRIDFAINRTANVTPDVIMSVGYGGNVGIGTTSPSQKLHVVGTGFASTDFRAPIFYDSDNTAYYVDAASTSSFNALNLASTLAINGGDGIRVFKSPASSVTSQIYWANGANTVAYNWQIDENSNAAMWGYGGVGWAKILTVYSTGGLAASILYDAANTAYYLDPASTSNLNALTVAGGNATIYRDLIVNGGASGNFGNRIIVQGTATTYTLQDTNVRPTVYLTGAYPVVTLNHTVTGNTNHGPTIQFAFNGLTTGGSTSRQILIGTSGDGNCLDFGFSGGGYGSNSDYNPHNGIAGYSGVTPMRLFSNGLLLGSTGVYPNNIKSTSFALDVRGTGSSDTDFRAPIFYDSNDTAYYVDPNSVSRLASLRVYSAFDTASSDVYANMRVMRNSATTDGMYIGYGNSGSTSALTRIFGGGATTGELSKYSNYTLEPGSFRSPIFYDSDNTAYYINPAGNSIVSSLTFDSNITIYKHNDRNLLIQGGGGTDAGLLGRGSSGQFAFQVYGSGSGSYGFLDGAWAGWDIRKVVDGDLFLNDNNTYYLNPGSTTNLNNLTVAGTLTVTNIAKNSTSPIVINSGSSASLGLRVYYDMNLYNTLVFTDSAWNSQGRIFGSSSVVTIQAATTTTSFVKYAGYSEEGGSFRAPIFYDSNDTTYYIDPANGGFNLRGGNSNRVTFNSGDSGIIVTNAEGVSSNVRLGCAWGRPGIYNGSSITVGAETTIDFVISNLVKGYIDSSSNLFSNGSVRSPIFYDSNNTAFYTDPASTSVLNRLTIDGGNYAFDYFQSLSDFTSGTLVTTDIPATAAEGESFVMNVVGKSYSASNSPFNFTVQGYLYSSTIINFSGIKLDSTGLTSVKIFENGGVLCFWWPTISYWNAFEVSVRAYNSAKNNYNRVTNITNSTEPTGTKKVTVTLQSFLRADVSATNSVDLRAPIFYDSNDTTYYTDPSSLSNILELKTNKNWYDSSASAWGGGINMGGNNPSIGFQSTASTWWYMLHHSSSAINFYRRSTSGSWNHDGIWDSSGNFIWQGSSVRAPIFYDQNNTALYCDPNGTSNFTGLTVANTITGSVSGNAATATNVAWTGITQATRTNYDLTFQPPNSGYAGFTFNTTGGVAGSAGYFLIRGTSDTDVYTAEGITLVADAGWLTLAQRTTASKGVRLMTGTTSTERLKITTAGDIQFVNGNSFTYNSNVVLHAGNYGGYSAFTSSLTSTVDARAPIFYDSNDTTYYLDPANTTLSLKTRSSIVINNASAPNNLAMLNIGYNGGGETRAIDIQGSWSGGENKSITFTHSSGSTNIVAQINAQHNGPGSKLRWGKLHHSGDSSTYTMELISESTTSAYLYVAGSVRTPIFYDSDNTAYYIDAASASILNTIRLTGKLTNNGSVSDDDGFGVYWDSGESTAYAIYREAGSWTNPFPDLRIAFHTGIKIGANAGYNGVRFYDDYGMGTQVMSVNNGSDGLGANNVYVNNSLQAGSSLRAPIFYDSNDTTYYVDPNSLSNIRHTIFHIGSNVVGATGIGVLFDGNYTSGQYRHRFRKYDDGNGLPLYVDYAHATANSFTAIARFGGGGSYNPFSVYGTADASGDFRAPIFYDSNDTGYYLDPRSASVLSGLKLNGIGNDAAGNTSDAILWINKPDNNDWGIRVTGNLEYLLKLEGATSHTYNIQGLANGSEFWRCGTDLLYHNSNIRAPIFYDSDNTGYYLNPAGNSQVVSIYANDWFRAQGNTGLYFQDKGYGITSAGAASNSYGNASTYGTGVNGWQGWGIGSRHCMMSTGGDNFGVHDNTRSWLYYWDGTYHRFQYGYLQSANSVRGPLFYDSDNTAYYLDPASTSNLNSLDIAGTLSSAAYNNLSNDYKDIYVYGDVNTYYVVLIQGEYLYSFGRYSVTRGYNWHGPDTWNTASHKGGLTLDWEWSGDTAWGGNDKSIRIIEFNETYSTMVAGLGYPVNGGVIIWLRGGGTNGALYRIRTPLGSNSTVIAYDGVSAANHSSSTTFTAADSAVFSTRANTSNVSSEILARYPVRGAATLNNEGNGVLDQGSTSQSKSGILSSSASLRAPIFYDSANTGYYVDPDSTSNLYVLSVASNATAAQYYTGGWFRNSTSGNGLYNEATGQHFYSDSANYWNVASSASAQGIRLRTGGHAGTVRGYFYADTNNDVGLLNQDGAWRLRVVGGDYSLADGSSMRAQLFYDSNDTAYYTNLAGRRDTNINGFTARTKMTLGLTAKYQLDRADYTGDGNYWTGVMGWGTTDFNTMITWGSGFIDSWSSPGNSPGTYTHFVGIQSLHYTNGDTDGTDNYGYQLVAGGGTTSPLYLRVNWGSAGSWRTMLDSSNYNSYSPTLTGTGASGSWGISVTGSSASCTGNAATVTNGMYLSGDQFISGAKYFTSNKGATSTVGANSTYSLEAYSNDAGAAGMSFHRGGYYAVNMGLDPDNIMRIGGWSAAANRWELDMSGNNWVASSFRAPIFYDSNNTAYYLDPASTSVLNRINLNTAATAYMQWRSAGQGTISGGFPFYHNASYGSINIEVSDNDTGGLVIDNEGVTVYGAGDNGQVFRVIDEDVYQATSNITASTTFYVNQLQNGGGGILGPFSISGTATAASFSGAGTGLTGTAASLSIGGNAANVTGTVAIANGGTGATTNANARTNLGATTVGSNLFTLTNPSAITFLRVNADNTVSALNASDFRNAIGAGGGGVTVETSVTQSLSGTTGCTIDVAAANVHILSLANATTISSFTYNNRNNNPSVNTLMIVLKYAGNASITWTNVIWSNNINPTLTQASGYADVFMLTSYKGGAGTPVWIGTVVAAGLVSTNL